MLSENLREIINNNWNEIKTIVEKKNKFEKNIDGILISALDKNKYIEINLENNTINKQIKLKKDAKFIKFIYYLDCQQIEKNELIYKPEYIYTFIDYYNIKNPVCKININNTISYLSVNELNIYNIYMKNNINEIYDNNFILYINPQEFKKYKFKYNIFKYYNLFNINNY